MGFLNKLKGLANARHLPSSRLNAKPKFKFSMENNRFFSSIDVEYDERDSLSWLSKVVNEHTWNNSNKKSMIMPMKMVEMYKDAIISNAGFKDLKEKIRKDYPGFEFSRISIKKVEFTKTSEKFKYICHIDFEGITLGGC